eukprot:1818378-Rhodomonas_salina.2
MHYANQPKRTGFQHTREPQRTRQLLLPLKNTLRAHLFVLDALDAVSPEGLGHWQRAVLAEAGGVLAGPARHHHPRAPRHLDPPLLHPRRSTRVRPSEEDGGGGRSRSSSEDARRRGSEIVRKTTWGTRQTEGGVG